MKAERITLWCNKIIKSRITWYILGFFTFIVIVCAMHHYGLIRDSAKIISEWRITANEEGKIQLVQPDGYFLIKVAREPNDKTWKEVSMTRVFPKENKGFGFFYKNNAVAYITGERMLWRDFNCDGQFDLKTDFQKKQTEIYLKDQWIKVHYDGNSEQAKTNEGIIYRFDANAGEWKVLEPKDINEKSSDTNLP